MPKIRSIRVERIPSPTALPASRASWLGMFQLGPVAVSVKAYPAVVATSNRSLNQVHAECGQRIEHRKTCPKHGQVNADQIARVYSLAPGDDLRLTDAELATIHPQDDRTIHIEHLVPGDQVHLALLSGRTLYLVPAHPPAESAYALLVETLSRGDRWAIGRMVLSTQRQLVAIHAVGRVLLLHVLAWPGQQRACPNFGASGAKVTADSLRTLAQSLAELERPFAWDDYRDEFELSLHELIRGKVAARTKRPAKPSSGESSANRTASPRATVRRRPGAA